MILYPHDDATVNFVLDLPQPATNIASFRFSQIPIRGNLYSHCPLLKGKLPGSVGRTHVYDAFAKAAGSG